MNKNLRKIKIINCIFAFIIVFAVVFLPNIVLQNFVPLVKSKANGGNTAPIPPSYVSGATNQGTYISTTATNAGWIVWQVVDKNNSNHPVCSAANDGSPYNSSGVSFVLEGTQTDATGSTATQGSQYIHTSTVISTPLGPSSGFIDPSTSAAVLQSACWYGIKRNTTTEAQNFKYRLWEYNSPSLYGGNTVQSDSYTQSPILGIVSTGSSSSCTPATGAYCGLNYYPNGSWDGSTALDGWNFGQIQNWINFGILTWQKTGTDIGGSTINLPGTTWNLVYTANTLFATPSTMVTGLTDCVQTDSNQCTQNGTYYGDQDGRPGYFSVQIPSSYTGTWQLVENSAPFGYNTVTISNTVSISIGSVNGSYGVINDTSSPQYEFINIDSSGNIITPSPTPSPYSSWTLTNSAGQNKAVTDCVGNLGPGSVCPSPSTYYSDTNPNQSIVKGFLDSNGNWTLKEASPPSGYEPDPSTYTSNGTPTPSPSSSWSNGYLFGNPCPSNLNAYTPYNNAPMCITNLKSTVVRWQKTDVDTGNLLSGSQFSLTDGGSNNWTVNDCTSSPCTPGTGNDLDPAPGKFAVENVPAGSWVLSEQTAPTGYSINTTPNNFSVSSTDTTKNIGTITDTHVPQISWKKVDVDAPTALLPGASFSLSQGSTTYNVSDCVASPCTAPSGGDPNLGWDTDPTPGSFTVWLPTTGVWNYSETTPPSGYTPGTPGQWTVLECTNSQAQPGCKTTLPNVTNSKIYPGLTWTKTDSNGKALSGSEWTLTNTTTSKQYTVVDYTGQSDYNTTCTQTGYACDTDSSVGNFKVTNVGEGVFSLTELVAPNGYAPYGQTLTSSSLQGVSSYTFSNNTVNSKPVMVDKALPIVQWNKIDKNTKTLLSGSQWSLKSISGTSYSYNITDCVANTAQDCPGYGQIGADQDPSAGSFSVQLTQDADGVGYSLEETTAPTNYVPLNGILFPLSPKLDAKVIPTIVNDSLGNPYNDSSGNIFNTPQLATIVWEKVDSLTKQPLTGSTWTLTPNSSSGFSDLTVTDCTSSPCDANSVDQDPNSGFYSVTVDSVGADSNPVQWTLAETVVPAGYTAPDLSGLPATVSTGQTSTIFNTQYCSVTQTPCPSANTTSVITNDPIPSVVMWQKTDTNNNKINGASFSLCPVTSANPNGDCNSTSTSEPVITVVDQDSTNSNSYGPCTLENGQCDTDPNGGSFSLSTQYRGQYVLYEKTSPNGYELDSSPLCTINLLPGSTQNCNAIVNDAKPIVTWKKEAVIDSTSTGPSFLQPGSQWSLVSTDGSQTLSVTDCTSSPCDVNSVDQDPTVGQFKVSLPANGLSWNLTESVVPSGFSCNSDSSITTCPTFSSSSSLGVNDSYEFYDPSAPGTSSSIKYIPNYALKPTISWEKIDSNSNPIADSSWSLTSTSGTVLTVDDNTGQDNYQGQDLDPRPGYFLVTSILPDNQNWTLVETAPPSGYLPLPNPTVWSGNVSPGGNYSPNPIINSSLPHILWNKTNAYDLVSPAPSTAPYASFPATQTRAELENSVFTLVDTTTGSSTSITDCIGGVAQDCAGYGQPGFDQNPAVGEFDVIVPDLHTYSIQETTAPNGYNAITGNIPAITATPTANTNFNVSYSQPNKSAQPGDVQDSPITGTLSWEKLESVSDGSSLSTQTIKVPGTTWQISDSSNNSGDAWKIIDNNKNATVDLTVECAANPQVPPIGYACDSDSRIGFVQLSNIPITITGDSINDVWQLVEILPASGYQMSTPAPTQTAGLNFSTQAPLPGPTNSFSPLVNSNLPAISWEKVDANATITPTPAPSGTSTTVASPLPSSGWELKNTTTNQNFSIADCVASPCPTPSNGIIFDSDPKGGSFSVNNLPAPANTATPDLYTLSETTVPDYYQTPSPNPVATITATPGATSSPNASIKNTHYGQISWNKIDSVSDKTNAYLPGSAWSLVENGGANESYTGIADCVAASAKDCPNYGDFGVDINPAQGEFTIETGDVGINTGNLNWTLNETTVPDGYDPSSAVSKTFTQYSCSQASSDPSCKTDLGDLENTRLYPIFKWKKTDSTGNTVLPDSSWTISHNLAGGSQWTVQDNSGQADYSTTCAASAFACDLDPRPGYFSVTNVSDASTSSSTYTLTETTAPYGYIGSVALTSPQISNGTTYTFVNNITTTSITNNALPILAFNKTDTAGNLLGNSEWTLTSSNDQSSFIVSDCIKAPCTDSTGSGVYDNNPSAGSFNIVLPQTGDWSIQEKVAPSSDYALDDTIYSVPETVLNETYTIGNVSLPKTIGNVFNSTYPILQWEKVDKDNKSNHIAGSVWNLTENNNEQKTITNILDCIASVKDLCTGQDLDPRAGYFSVELGTITNNQNWTLTEQSPPYFYSASTQSIPSVTVSLGQIVSFGAITNPHLPQVSWNKTDEFNSSLPPLSGSEWKLTNGNNSFTISDCVVTGATDGTTDSSQCPNYSMLGNDTDPRPGYFSVTLPNSGNWTAQETQSPPGYRSLKNSLNWNVLSCEKANSECATSEGSIENEPFTPTVSIHLTDVNGNDLASSVWNLTDNGNNAKKVANSVPSAKSSSKTKTNLKAGSVYKVVDNIGQSGYITQCSSPGYYCDLDSRPGYLWIPELTQGNSYTISENQPPVGYISWVGSSTTPQMEETTVFTVQQDTINNQLVVINHQLPTLTWEKLDSSNNSLLGGSSWNLTQDSNPTNQISIDDCVSSTLCTNIAVGKDIDPSAGKFKIWVPNTGVWKMQEKSAPDGYIINTKLLTTQDMQLDNDYSLGSITNDKKPTPTPPTPTPNPTSSSTTKPTPKPSPSKKPTPKPSPSHKPPHNPSNNGNKTNDYCTNSKYNSKKTCSEHGYSWHSPAHCSDKKYKNKSACIKHGNKWYPPRTGVEIIPQANTTSNLNSFLTTKTFQYFGALVLLIIILGGGTILIRSKKK